MVGGNKSITVTSITHRRSLGHHWSIICRNWVTTRSRISIKSFFHCLLLVKPRRGSKGLIALFIFKALRKTCKSLVMKLLGCVVQVLRSLKGSVSCWRRCCSSSFVQYHSLILSGHGRSCVNGLLHDWMRSSLLLRMNLRFLCLLRRRLRNCSLFYFFFLR